MKKIFALVLGISMFLGNSLKADEGMWLLPLLQKLNAKGLKDAGLKLSPEEIYSINNSSIKDALVIFAGGCTGEIISKEGLLITNHHCGYAAIQQHSTVEHDYLKDGFWAKTRNDEMPTPDLKVTFLERIVDVTDQILPIVSKIADNEKREKATSDLIKKISKKYDTKREFHEILIVPMYGGNNFYLFEYKHYKDVRMVGAPPSSIGKFGADSDNWMWPRHTGDFSMFRIYAKPDGSPAEYSEDNVPFVPKHHLPISLKGVKENDFAMVMGFPGSTNRYMTSWEVEQRMNVDNANRIHIRGIRQEIMMNDMQSDPKIRIQYANKYAGSSNYWKNSMGMNVALKNLSVVERKKDQEKSFADWVVKYNKQQEYGNTLSKIEKAVTARASNANASQYISEALTRSCEFVGYGSSFIPLYEAISNKKTKAKDVNVIIEKLKENVPKYFKNYNIPTDKKISVTMLDLYTKETTKDIQPKIFEEIGGLDKTKYVDEIFSTSVMVSEDKINELLAKPHKEILAALKNDKAFQLALSCRDKTKEFSEANKEHSLNFKAGHREYVRGLLEMSDRPMYPDANFTMRLTYGKVMGYDAKDGVYYKHYTTLAGIMEKEDPNNWEYVVPAKLKDLYKSKDFGDYAENGTVPVNFIFDGDITGGNSGSPVLNADGHLIGLAFDGNWEALSGDIAFEAEKQRCINIDIRYALFIIEKYADSKHLIDEMTIVK